MPALYVRGKKYSGSIDSEARIVQDVVNDPASIPSSAVVYDIQESINSKIGKITSFEMQVVTDLPHTGVKGVIYLIKDTHSDSNDYYDEYIWVPDKSAYEKIGNTDVDLTDYVEFEDLEEISKDELESMWYNA